MTSSTVPCFGCQWCDCPATRIDTREDRRQVPSSCHPVMDKTLQLVSPYGAETAVYTWPLQQSVSNLDDDSCGRITLLLVIILLSTHT